MLSTGCRRCCALTLAAVLSILAFPGARGTAQELRLLRLPGDTVDVHYSPGSLDRAAHVQRRLEVLAATLTDWTGYRMTGVVYVLSRADWEAANAGPHYGIPGRVTGDALAIAAEGDMELARFWHHLLGRPAPQLPGVPLVGPPEGADALAVSDLFLQLEATAAMLRQPGWAANTPLTTRLAVHLTAWDVLSVREPERTPQLDRIFSDLGQWPTSPVTAEGLTVEEWVGLEAHFYQGARIVREEVGKLPAKKLLKRTAKTDGVIRLEPMTRRNQRLSARLTEWSQELTDRQQASADGAGDG